MSMNESIKKMQLKYVKCNKGGLHQGQLMNMICLDNTCLKRGLICPICRMEQHQNHQILPIKTFLEHIRSMFGQSDNNQQLNSLSGYLRALQNAKKQIIGTLKSQVKKLADSFQALQIKIQENFTSVRKNVMIQSSITTKLPSLLTLLTEQNVNKNPDLIHQQFKSYTELLKYENQKLKVSDKAKSLVQNYSLIPSKLGSLFSTNSQEFIKKLEAIPKLFQEKIIKNNDKAQQMIPLGSYTFNKQNKHYELQLNQNNKLVKTFQQCESSGYIFVNENKGSTKQKIAVEIVSNSSQNITLGLGDVQQFKNSIVFINNSDMDNHIDKYDFIYPDGIVKITNQNLDGLSDFSFATGDKIQITYNGEQIIYYNRNTQMKHISPSTFSQISKPNIQFVFGLSEGDSIRIIDQ